MFTTSTRFPSLRAKKSKEKIQKTFLLITLSLKLGTEKLRWHAPHVSGSFSAMVKAAMKINLKTKVSFKYSGRGHQVGYTSKLINPLIILIHEQRKRLKNPRENLAVKTNWNENFHLNDFHYENISLQKLWITHISIKCPNHLNRFSWKILCFVSVKT